MPEFIPSTFKAARLKYKSAIEQWWSVNGGKAEPTVADAAYDDMNAARIHLVKVQGSSDLGEDLPIHPSDSVPKVRKS